MSTGLELAIIGLACRFPGAHNPAQLWRNLRTGKESITHFAADELAAAGVPAETLADPSYVRAHGLVPGAELFDAEFFGISPKEADVMDPQQRILLECTWEALEDSGHDPARVNGQIGVYAGTYYNTYLPHLPPTADIAEQFARNIANEKDYVASRIAYKLDLTGPALTVQTACSTSLVAVHLACQALLSGDCDLALAGGATVRARQVSGYHFQPGGIFSPDGHCRTFDASGAGTVPSNGAGMVVLKRLADALADQDAVYAVIRGSAIGNDGADRVGFTAPGVDGQARVISAAHTVAEIDPATISYVETHGSATQLGDPVEIEALTRAFRAGGTRPGSCAVGSIKTNIGHTHAAAGVAGLIKATLAVRHGLIPPSLHFERPNPAIDFAATPFFVNTATIEWPSGGQPRRAGVSSFGMGGTGAHVVLEEAPLEPPARRSMSYHLAPISARTEEVLEAATDRLAGHLVEHTDLDFGDVAHTLRAGRRGFAHRRVVVATDSAGAAKALAARDPRTVYTGTSIPRSRSVAFMFPGLGDQRPGMGHRLYRSQPAFRSAVDRCAELLSPLMGIDIRTVLYSSPDTEDGAARVDLRRMLGRDRVDVAEGSELHQIQYAHALLFATEYALAELWMAYGVRPAALIGYSLGEYVAACLSGVLRLEDALRLVVVRAQLIADLPPGGMLAVPAAEPAISPLLPPAVSVAAVNGPSLCVVAGPVPAVVGLKRRLEAQGMAVRLLPTTHAFHSPMMKPIVDPFVDVVGTVALAPPQIPYVSNVTGRWMTAQQATDPASWGEHLWRPVQFGTGVAELWREPDRLLLELGPGQTLGSVALQMRPAAGSSPEPGTLTLSSLPGALDRESEERFFLGAAAKLWLAGVDLAWSAEPASPAHRRVPLPAYPFQRHRHWIDTVPVSQPPGAAPSLAKKAQLSDWFYVPAWAPLAPHPRGAAEAPQGAGSWLVFVDDLGIGQTIATTLAEAGHTVTTVAADTEPSADGGLRRVSADGYRMPPRAGGYQALLGELRERDRYPDRIIHLWTVGAATETGPCGSDGRATLGRGLFSLLGLAQALSHQPDTDPIELVVVSSDLQVVTGTERCSPLKAAVLGPCRVLPLEHPHISSRSIDIAVPEEPSQRYRSVEHLLAEVLHPAGEPVVALRGNLRWQQVHQRVRIGPGKPPPHGRTYLITGGLGGIGLTIARELARAEHAGVVLVGRTALPDRDEWTGWLAAHPLNDETSARIRAVREIEELGTPVLVLTANVTDVAAMQAVAARAANEIGPIYGIIHAAGVAGGGLIQLKDPASVDRVLAAKVPGALVIEQIAREVHAEVVVLCSSTLSITGAVGQVDYVAANAVLDALAAGAGTTTGGPEVISINWDAWQDVGMAHRHIGDSGTDGGGRVGPVDHPLLDACLEDTHTYSVYGATFSAATSWLVDEHRMLGHPVVPGTAYLELARSAFAHLTGGGPVELSNVRFYTPAVLDEHEVRQLRVVLDKTVAPTRFTVVSRYNGDPDGGPQWQVHATGEVSMAAPAHIEHRDLALLTGGDRLTDRGRPTHSGPMRFGPRSRCLRRIWHTGTEALAELELPEQFTDDLDHLHLHPSLMDLAAGYVGLNLAEEFRIPISYGRVRCYRPLPRRIFSHHRYREADRAGKETTTAEITLLDADGQELVHIDEFVLKRAPTLRETLVEARDGGTADVALFHYPQPLPHEQPARAGLLDAHLANGIRPDEGAEAFRRIMAAGIGPRVVVAAKDLAAMIADVAGTRLRPAATMSTRRGSLHPRPNVLTPYRPPSDELEELLATVWQDLLGVERVGIDDVFFELGGHSLLGLELANRLRRLGLEISLGLLFEARTVAELASVLRPVVADAEATASTRQSVSITTGREAGDG